MMTSLCNETAWTRSPPFYTPKPFLSIFVRVSTLSTIGFLAEARWNLAAMASFRLTSRRGAVGTVAMFAHSRKNYIKKKILELHAWPKSPSKRFYDLHHGKAFNLTL